MFSTIFNWRTWLSLIAIVIVVATVVFSNFLAGKIANEEKQKIELWVEAIKDAANPNTPQTNLATKVMTEHNKDIPMILTNENDSIIDSYNLDTFQIASNKNYLSQKLSDFKNTNNPIVWTNPYNGNEKSLVYYGHSKLLNQIKYFPMLQLLVVALFILITLWAINTRNKSTQNQVWAGMAKEAAHQLGTPITSLEGWVEMLKTKPDSEEIAAEMSKDVDRLKLVSDRFGKIGSTPQLEATNIVMQVEAMVAYIKRIASDKVHFSIRSNDTDVNAMINPPLFDWVIENLLKNALDAMEGKGNIAIDIKDEAAETIIDVTDSGKGISRNNIPKVFKPGFSTKKRGWGLGLTLSKRIIEQYHKGELFVKHSEPGKGTTFRIILKK